MTCLKTKSTVRYADCPEFLHNIFSGKCTGGHCMCPGLITDDEDYKDFEDFLERRRSHRSALLWRGQPEP